MVFVCAKAYVRAKNQTTNHFKNPFLCIYGRYCFCCSIAFSTIVSNEGDDDGGGAAVLY